MNVDLKEAAAARSEDQQSDIVSPVSSLDERNFPKAKWLMDLEYQMKKDDRAKNAKPK